MGYLLDTHIVIWAIYEPEKITYDVEQILLDRSVPVYFSAVNLWEVAIKAGLGRFDIVGINTNELYQTLKRDLYSELPVLSKHCFVLENLPAVHNDPFDRLLISQAIAEDLTLITHDKDILKYNNLKTLKA